jgi:YHS domain-containing protein
VGVHFRGRTTWWEFSRRAKTLMGMQNKSMQSLLPATAAVLALLAVIFSASLVAQKKGEPVASVFTREDRVAVSGYDPVAYFAMGKPVAGKAEFFHEWNGAKWVFASAANRNLFKANPGNYAPQFGGYCAWAVSEGYTAPADPKAWKIVDGKLYLNYNTDVQKRWSQDIPGRVAKGESNWPKLHK